MPTQRFDRLNIITTGSDIITANGNIQKIGFKPIPIDRYFNEMLLSQTQKKERIALARDLEDVMMFFFSMVLVMNEYSYMSAISTVDAKEQLRNRVYDTVSSHTELTDEMKSFLDDYVDDVSDTTTEHMAILAMLTGDDEETERKRAVQRQYTSNSRAILLAEEEANTIFNLADFDKALRSGYKYKKWRTMRDNLVRPTHAVLEDKTIPINELFVVGETLMRFPRDELYAGASHREIIKCRCSIQYLKTFI